MSFTKRSYLSVLMALGAALITGGGVALASGPQQGMEPTLVAASATAEEGGLVAVSVQFADADGQAYSGQEVSFFLQTDFLGQDQVLLAKGATDETGTARHSYAPTWDGTQRVVARLAETGGNQAMETTVIFDVSGLGNPYVPEPPALGRLRSWTPVIVGATVVMVWAVLAVVSIRTVRGIRAGARTPEAVRGPYPVPTGPASTGPPRRPSPAAWRRQ